MHYIRVCIPYGPVIGEDFHDQRDVSEQAKATIAFVDAIETSSLDFPQFVLARISSCALLDHQTARNNNFTE